jgi:outer membrane immunogenic protein
MIGYRRHLEMLPECHSRYVYKDFTVGHRAICWFDMVFRIEKWRCVMRKFSLALVSAVAAIGLTQSASAADLPVKAPIYKAPPVVAQTWTGCYIGGSVGSGWSHTNVNDEISGAPIAELRASALVGGGQIGCDYQFAGDWLIGVQGMYDASGLKADTTSPVLAPLTLHGSIPWFATATARLGYVAAPNWLFYVKGGGAWTHTDATLLFAGTVVDTASFDQSGWTGGGGVEWKFAPNWSVFAEYDYLGFRDKTVTFASGANIGTVHQNVQVALIGVNFRFSGLFH